MNIIDMIILGILGISVLIGLYRGFVSTVLNTGGCLLSLGLSFWLYPKLNGLIQQDSWLQHELLTYTDASSRIGDLELSLKKVATLTADGINEIVTRANLPQPLSELLRGNLSGQIYNGIDNVSQYVSETIVSAFINILCFLLCFAAVYLVLSLVFSAVRAVFQLPVLKQFDSLLGGVFGLLRGVLLVFVLFTLLPIVQTVLPSVSSINELLSSSTLAPFFTGGGLVTAIMNGRL